MQFEIFTERFFLFSFSYELHILVTTETHFASFDSVVVALEECKVSSNLIPIKSLIQGAACKVLKKTDLAVQVGK